MSRLLPPRLSSFLDRRGCTTAGSSPRVSFLTLITAAGFRSTAGVLIVPLQDEFGWRRATISVAVSINLILYGLGGPFAAGLYDRFGMRKVIVIALATIAISSTLTTQMAAPWQLDVLWGVANGLATGAIGVTLAAVIANRWFVKRRGLVTGMLTASNATGQLVFLPLLGWIVTRGAGERLALTVSSSHRHSRFRSSSCSCATARRSSGCDPSARPWTTPRCRRTIRSARRSEASSQRHDRRRSGCSPAASSSAARRRMG